MHTIKDGYDGLSLLAKLTSDRFLFLGGLTVALCAAPYLVSL